MFQGDRGYLDDVMDDHVPFPSLPISAPRTFMSIHSNSDWLGVFSAVVARNSLQLSLAAVGTRLWRKDMFHSVIFFLSLFDEALMTPPVCCNYSAALGMFVLVLTGHCCDHIRRCSIISHYNIHYFSFHFG